jgi:hypothetical protein
MALALRNALAALREAVLGPLGRRRRPERSSAGWQRRWCGVSVAFLARLWRRIAARSLFSNVVLVVALDALDVGGVKVARGATLELVGVPESSTGLLQVRCPRSGARGGVRSDRIANKPREQWSVEDVRTHVIEALVMQETSSVAAAAGGRSSPKERKRDSSEQPAQGAQPSQPSQQQQEQQQQEQAVFAEMLLAGFGEAERSLGQPFEGAYVDCAPHSRFGALVEALSASTGNRHKRFVFVPALVADAEQRNDPAALWGIIARFSQHVVFLGESWSRLEALQDASCLMGLQANAATCLAAGAGGEKLAAQLLVGGGGVHSPLAAPKGRMSTLNIMRLATLGGSGSDGVGAGSGGGFFYGAPHEQLADMLAARDVLKTAAAKVDVAQARPARCIDAAYLDGMGGARQINAEIAAHLHVLVVSAIAQAALGTAMASCASAASHRSLVSVGSAGSGSRTDGDEPDEQDEQHSPNEDDQAIPRAPGADGESGGAPGRPQSRELDENEVGHLLREAALFLDELGQVEAAVQIFKRAIERFERAGDADEARRAQQELAAMQDSLAAMRQAQNSTNKRRATLTQRNPSNSSTLSAS